MPEPAPAVAAASPAANMPLWKRIEAAELAAKEAADRAEAEAAGLGRDHGTEAHRSPVGGAREPHHAAAARRANGGLRANANTSATAQDAATALKQVNMVLGCALSWMRYASVGPLPLRRAAFLHGGCATRALLSSVMCLYDSRQRRRSQAAEVLEEAEAALEAPPPQAVAGGRPLPAEIGELVAEGRGLPADPRLLAELTAVLDTVSDWEAAARRSEGVLLRVLGTSEVRAATELCVILIACRVAGKQVHAHRCIRGQTCCVASERWGCIRWCTAHSWPTDGVVIHT